MWSLLVSLCSGCSLLVFLLTFFLLFFSFFFLAFFSLFLAHCPVLVGCRDPKTRNPKDVESCYATLLKEANVVRGTCVVVQKQLGMTYGECICAFAWDNDCHVLSMGTDGMRTFLEGSNSQGGAFGSTSDHCVKYCKCNVLVSKVKGCL